MRNFISAVEMGFAIGMLVGVVFGFLAILWAVSQPLT